MAQKHNSTNTSNTHANPCDDCIRMKKRREESGFRFDGSQDKYCKKHQCPFERKPGIKCYTRKSKDERQCTEHPVPQCCKDDCDMICDGDEDYCPNHLCSKKGCGQQRRSRSQYCQTHTCVRNGCYEICAHLSLFCQRDTCIYRGCQKHARPEDGIMFCPDHKCSRDSCQYVKKHVEARGLLYKMMYCSGHECRTDLCREIKAPNKEHCMRHCCTKQDCKSFRESNLPGTFCLQHYANSIRDQTREEIQAQIAAQVAAQNHAQALHDIQRQDQERRLQQEEEEEVIQKAMRESAKEQHRKEEEAARVKAEREERRVKREQADIDCAVREGIEIKLRRDREIAQAANQARVNAERDAEEARLRRETEDRLEREEERQQVKREQDARRRAEKDEYRLRPEDATQHNRRVPTYETTRAQRGSYIDPRRRRDTTGTFQGYDDGYESASPGPRGLKREHSPRVSREENMYDAEDDDYLRADDGPSRSRPYGGNMAREQTPKVNKDIWGM